MTNEERADGRPSLFCCAVCGQFRHGRDAGQKGGMIHPHSGQAISSWICSHCVAAAGVTGSPE